MKNNPDFKSSLELLFFEWILTHYFYKVSKEWVIVWLSRGRGEGRSFQEEKGLLWVWTAPLLPPPPLLGKRCQALAVSSNLLEKESMLEHQDFLFHSCSLRSISEVSNDPLPELLTKQCTCHLFLFVHSCFRGWRAKMACVFTLAQGLTKARIPFFYCLAPRFYWNSVLLYP